MSVPYYGDYPEDHTHVIIPINTFSSNDPSASVTVTNLLNTDVHIHKDGAVAQRNNAAGITMTVDFDGITGNHVLIIDTSDNTVAGFYVTGKEYQVRIEGPTVDGGTINAFVGTFSIERAGGVLALLKAGTVDVNTKTITAGSIANASFNADVGSTAHGTNIIALACRKILEELNLDHLLKVTTGVAADADLEAYCVAGTVMSHILSTGADVTTFKPSTDSLEAIRNHVGDGTNLTEAGGDGDHLTESGGTGDQLTAINLPNQTMDITGDITGNLSGSVGSLTGHTNQTGDSFARIGALGVGLTAITDDTGNIPASPATSAKQDTAQTDLDTITGTGGVLIGTDAMDRSGTLDVNAKTVGSKTGYTLSAAGNTAVIDEFETQAAADPTGFKVNIMEVNSTAQTAGDLAAAIATAQTDLDELTDAGTLSGIRLALMLDRIYCRLNHEVNVTDATGAMAIRNAADNADIATGNITDNDTLTQQTVVTWS